MEILRGYSLGKNIWRLQQRFRYEKAVVTKAGRYYVWKLRTERGVNHGDLVSPTVFRILLDAVIRAAMTEVRFPQEAQHGLVFTVRENIIVL